RRRILLVVDHLQGAREFLLGDEQRRIDVEGFLEQGGSVLQLSVVAQFLSTMDNRGRGLETAALERGSIAQILRFEIVSLFEEVVGLFVILASFGVLALGVQVFRLIGEGGKYCNRDQRQQ